MHHQAVNILFYGKETTNYGLKYKKGQGSEESVCFTYNDLAGDINDRKNTAGMTFYLNENVIS